MTLNELTDQARETLGSSDPARITDWLLERVMSGFIPLDLLYPALYSYVAATERARVREVEKDVFPGSGTAHPERPSSPRAEPYVNPAQAAMQRLLAETCRVPDDQGVMRLVRWGDMTPALHRRYIAAMADRRDAYVAGVNATIARHQAAIDLLETSHCNTLTEYVDQGGEVPAAVSGEAPANV